MFESVSWPFELETTVPFVSYVNGKIKESDSTFVRFIGPREIITQVTAIPGFQT